MLETLDSVCSIFYISWLKNLNFPLQMGTFSVASEEVLKNRAIKKAKRRNMGLEVYKLHYFRKCSVSLGCSHVLQIRYYAVLVFTTVLKKMSISIWVHN